MFSHIVLFLHDPKQRKSILLRQLAYRRMRREMYGYAMLTLEVLRLGVDRSCRAEVAHDRRMEPTRNTVDARDNAAQFVKGGVNARPRHRSRHSGQLLANVVMQVTSDPRSPFLLGGNDTRGQTLALARNVPWLTCALFMLFLHAVNCRDSVGPC